MPGLLLMLSLNPQIGLVKKIVSIIGGDIEAGDTLAT